MDIRCLDPGSHKLIVHLLCDCFFFKSLFHFNSFASNFIFALTKALAFVNGNEDNVNVIKLFLHSSCTVQPPPQSVHLCCCLHLMFSIIADARKVVDWWRPAKEIATRVDYTENQSSKLESTHPLPSVSGIPMLCQPKTWTMKPLLPPSPITFPSLVLLLTLGN